MGHAVARQNDKTARPRLKSVAIPNEHGGWGFVSQPLLLGLLLAPSPAGVWLALATLGLFLSRHPLKLVIKDRSNGRTYARTRLAAQVVAVYLLIAFGGAALALATARAPFWQAIVLAAPFALVQFAYDASKRGREALPEIAGAIAIGAAGPAIMLAAGWPLDAAFASWVLTSLYAVTSILYIRARLRLERGHEIKRWPAWGSHAVMALVTAALASVGLLPWLSLAAVAVVSGRAWLGLSSRRKPTQAKTLGFREMGYSLGLVLLTVLGYSFGF